MITLDRLRQDGLLATEISKLESRLWRMASRDNLKTVQFTSAVRGEGKRQVQLPGLGAQNISQEIESWCLQSILPILLLPAIPSR